MVEKLLESTHLATPLPRALQIDIDNLFIDSLWAEKPHQFCVEQAFIYLMLGISSYQPVMSFLDLFALASGRKQQEASPHVGKSAPELFLLAIRRRDKLQHSSALYTISTVCLVGFMLNLFSLKKTNQELRS